MIPASRRRFLETLFGSAAALAGCGGGGGDAGSPAPAPSPGPQPSPAVDGPAWTNFGGNAQHTAQSAIAAQDLAAIHWQASVDLAPPYRPSGALLAHYAAPVITSHNTALVPVNTGTGFRVEARAGGNGVVIWSATTDYVMPPHNWVPSYNLALNSTNRVYAPGAGGKLLFRDNADSASANGWQTLVFYGASAYNAAATSYDQTVFINTPLTVDTQGNVYFGFRVTGANPGNLVSGIARIAADGTGSWVPAAAVAGDATTAKLATNAAPALSNDGQTLYVVVNADSANNPQAVQYGYLLALDSISLALKRRIALVEPSPVGFARISDDGTASPLVGPDGDVYIGVLEAGFGTHNGRGWLLHFDAALTTAKTPGSFGWDNTPSIVPAAMVPNYSGGSSYLLLTKYNNYAGVGTGDGKNRVAVLDPHDVQADPVIGTVSVMREVLTILGTTTDPAHADIGGVKEWCINTAAVDPATRSVLINSEDGYLYRWDLASNTFTQRIRMNNGIGQSYTPTAIGADGTVYAVNNAAVFAVGR
ncbi:MAG TPA: hypothetical protein VIO33_26705 [Burkholderiaceae bacterium]